jgi:hypothetical protein
MPGQDSAPQCQRTVIIVFGTLFMKYPENFDFLCQFQDAATVLAKSDSGGAGYASVQKVGSRRRSTTSGNKPNTRSASAKSALRKEDKVDAEELELKVKWLKNNLYAISIHVGIISQEALARSLETWKAEATSSKMAAAQMLTATNEDKPINTPPFSDSQAALKLEDEDMEECYLSVIIVFGTLFMKYPENFDFLCQFQDAATVLAKSGSGGAGYASVQKVGSRSRSTTNGNKPSTSTRSASVTTTKENCTRAAAKDTTAAENATSAMQEVQPDGINYNLKAVMYHSGNMYKGKFCRFVYPMPNNSLISLKI